MIRDLCLTKKNKKNCVGQCTEKILPGNLPKHFLLKSYRESPFYFKISLYCFIFTVIQIMGGGFCIIVFIMLVSGLVECLSVRAKVWNFVCSLESWLSKLSVQS